MHWVPLQRLLRGWCACGNSSLKPLAQEAHAFCCAPSLRQTLRLGEQPLVALAEWSPCRVVQPREQIQILHHHSSLQSPWQQTLTTYEDIVLATEKLPPSHAPALHTGPNAEERGQFLSWTDSFKWTVLGCGFDFQPLLGCMWEAIN